MGNLSCQKENIKKGEKYHRKYILKGYVKFMLFMKNVDESQY